MEIAFTGDLVLQQVKEEPEHIFKEFVNFIHSENIKLCINLESPFIQKGMSPIKNKISLHAIPETIKYLNYLNPNLINLSNNHVNDYGNESAKLTIDLIKSNGFNYTGVGYSSKKENVVIDSNIIYLTYTTRSADFTNSKLFADNDFIGPYAPDFDQISKLKIKYSTHKIIVNIHWGIEDIKYVEPSKRKIAKEIIDSGADMIIGHHPHIIQPIELYKNKYIFYSIGNFYFNDISYNLEKKLINKKALKHQKKGIVPVFLINDKIQLSKIYQVKINKLNVLETKIIKIKTSRPNEAYYSLFYKIYSFYLLNTRRILRVLKNPSLINKLFKR